MTFHHHIHYSTELEQSVLGICLLEVEAFGRVYGIINKDNFYHNSHRQIFEVMEQMFSLSLPIDRLTVHDWIVRQKRIEIEAVDNVPYFILKLEHHVTGSTHLEYWCHILQMMWLEREIISLTSRGATMLEGDARQKLQLLQEKVMLLNHKQHTEDFKDMSQLMVELYQHQDEMRERKGKGLTTGFSKLDELNGGFHPGEFVIIAARPSVGKSAIAGQMAWAMASIGEPVAFISLEMSNNQIAARITAIDTVTDFNIIYRGLYIDERQADRLHRRIADSTSTLPIYVSDKTGADIISIRAMVQKLNNKVKREQVARKQKPTGLAATFIDYLQLVEGQANVKFNREQEVSRISRGCKLMAKEMNSVVIALAQLSRAITQRKGDNRYPELSDLRESGSLEQDADIVIFAHKDWLAGVQNNPVTGESTENEADLCIAKWRNADANKRIPMEWIGKQMRFKEKGSFQELPHETYKTDVEEDFF